MAEFAANNHVSETTGVSAFLANQGHHPRMNFSLTPPQTKGPLLWMNDFVDSMSQADDHLRADDHLQAEMRFAQDRQESQANTSGSPAPRLPVGTPVWWLTKNIKTAGPSKKLEHKQLGPFTIEEVVSSHVYCLAVPPSMKIHLFSTYRWWNPPAPTRRGTSHAAAPVHGN